MVTVPKGNAGTIDWILSEDSQVHIANHRGWFINIDYFKTTLDFADRGEPGSLDVHGIGDVELELVKFEPDGAKGRKGYKFETIVLRDVHWVPGSDVNVVKWPLNGRSHTCQEEKSRDLRSKPSRPKLLDPITKEQVGYILQNRGQKERLWLSHRKANECSMAPSTIPSRIKAVWRHEEAERWKLHKEADVIGDSPKAWMKSRHRGEWQFFEKHGLDVYDEEDRAKAKLLVEEEMPGGSGFQKVSYKKKKGKGKA